MIARAALHHRAQWSSTALSEVARFAGNLWPARGTKNGGGDLMAIPMLSILKTLAPLAVDAGRIVAGLRDARATRGDERVARLEQETLRAGEVLRGLAEQLQAIAEAVRVQAERAEAVRRRAMVALAAGAVALGAAGTALVLVWMKLG